MKRLVLLLLVATIAPLAHARVTIPVTQCGQLVNRGQAGVLMSDLDCGRQWGTCWVCPGGVSCTPIEPAVSCSGRSDCPDPAADKCDGGEFAASVGVYVAPGARLYLNGHSISRVQFGIVGGYPDGTGGSGSIKVFGPGTIAKTRQATSFYNGSLSDGLTLVDGLFGVVATKGRMKDVDTSDNVIGVSVFETIRATRVVSDDNLYAGFLSYGRLRLSYSHATGSTVVDITSELPARVTNSVCDHSAALEETGQPGVYAPTGAPFGFCSGD